MHTCHSPEYLREVPALDPPPPRPPKDWAKFYSGPSADQKFSVAPSAPLKTGHHRRGGGGGLDLRDALERAEVTPSPSRAPSAATVRLTPSASLNSICTRQQPPPTALATSSNRLPNRSWGRL